MTGEGALICNYSDGGTCVYDNTTGRLSDDADSGLCPSAAIGSGMTNPPISAPTLTPWGLIIAALLLSGVAAFALRYRRMRGR
jgi:hypothetical protein